MILRATPEKKEEKERVRLALLRAALRLAEVHGFASLGLREVAREAAIAPTSFYRHFADLDELGLALIHDLVGPLVLSLADQVRQTGKGEDAAARLVDAMFLAVAGDPALVRFMVAEHVGASALMRAALREKFALLAAALCSRDGGSENTPALPAYAGEATTALLLDGFARALDRRPAERALREPLLLAMRVFLDASSATARHS